MRFILSPIVLIWSAVHLSAADYFVATTGIDSAPNLASHAIGTPVKTIQYVIDNAVLAGGDTVYIRGGNYSEDLTITSADSGSDPNYVTFASYGNEDVALTGVNAGNWTVSIYDGIAGGWTSWIKFDGSGGDGGRHFSVLTINQDNVFSLQAAHHVWLKNLVISGAALNGVKILSRAVGTDLGGVNDHSGSYSCVLEGCDLHHNGDYGIKITGWETRSNVVARCLIRQNGATGTSRYGMNISGSGYDRTVLSNLVESSLVWSNVKGGIGTTETIWNVFRSNTCWLNGSSGEGFGIQCGIASISNVIDSCNCYSNVIYGVNTYQASNNVTRFSTLWQNTQNQYESSSGSTSNQLYYCTLYGPMPIYLTTSTRSTWITNCAVESTALAAITVDGGATIGSDYNRYGRSGSANICNSNITYLTWAQWQALGVDANSTTNDPMWRAQAVGDFQPLPGSPLLGIAADIGMSSTNVGAWQSGPYYPAPRIATTGRLKIGTLKLAF